MKTKTKTKPATPLIPPRPVVVEPTYYYRNLKQIEDSDGVWDVGDRLPEVLKHADFRQEDTVLDLGCAEGLITLAIAEKVKHIRGVDIKTKRVRAARKIAEERGVQNIEFELGNVVEMDLPAQSYDAVMFLSVFQHLPRQTKWRTMVKVMNTAKRSVVFRTPIFLKNSLLRTTRLAHICQKLDFSLTIYPRQEPHGGGFMIMNRIGT